MDVTRIISSEKKSANRAACSVKMVMALLCLSLIVSGPYGSLPCLGSLGAKTAAAAPGDTQDSGSTDTAADDTPSEADIADFASEYDRDGDGEVDEPDDEEADEETDDASDEDESDQGDDHDDDQEDDQDDDRDGQDNLDDDDESGDAADTREDIDGESSPDYRVSGFKRYYADKRLRRVGEFSGLMPLIEREEQLLFEN